MLSGPLTFLDLLQRNYLDLCSLLMHLSIQKEKETGNARYELQKGYELNNEKCRELRIP